MAINAKIDLKKPVLEEISAQVEGAQCVLLVNYSGLTVAQDTQLRKELREAGVHYKVYKNTMMKRAFAGTAFESLTKDLDGTNAIAISKDDATAPARIIAKFAKNRSEAGDGFWCCRKETTTTKLEWKHWQTFRQEKNFLANCLEASSPRSQTWLASSTRSQSPKAAQQRPKPQAGSVKYAA